MKLWTETKPFYQRVGKYIRLARKSHGWTQAELGAKVFMHGPTITAIENGHQQLLTHQFVEIASALGYTPGELCPILQPDRADGPYGVDATTWDLSDRLA